MFDPDFVGQVQPFPRTPPAAPLARANPNPCGSAPNTPAHTQGTLDSETRGRASVLSAGRARPGRSRSSGLRAPSTVPQASPLVLEAAYCGKSCPGNAHGCCSERHTHLWLLKQKPAVLPAWGEQAGDGSATGVSRWSGGSHRGVGAWT